MLPIKNIHVVVGQGDDAAMSTAVDLARRFGAHLTGLAVEEQPELTHYMDEARALVEARVAAAGERFESAARQSGIDFSAATVAVPVNGSIEEILKRCRLSDLVVIAKAQPSDHFLSELIRQLLLDSAAPLLIVPSGQEGEPNYDRAAIAWDGRPVAAHAIRSALPLLELAREVTILTVLGREESPPDSSDLTAHLARHNVTALHRYVPAVGSISDALLDFISTEGINWMTMGAFGHGRIRELIFGSPTRDMLTGASIPILMHH